MLRVCHAGEALHFSRTCLPGAERDEERVAEAVARIRKHSAGIART